MSNILDKLLSMKDAKGEPLWSCYRIAKVGGFSHNTVRMWKKGWVKKPKKKNLEKLKEMEGMVG